MGKARKQLFPTKIFDGVWGLQLRFTGLASWVSWVCVDIMCHVFLFTVWNFSHLVILFLLHHFFLFEAFGSVIGLLRLQVGILSAAFLAFLMAFCSNL